MAEKQDNGGGNGYDRAVLERLLIDIDDADARLDSLRGSYMADCKGVRQDIKAVFDQAKDLGIPKKAFKVIVENRRLDKKIAANVDKLDEEQVADYEKLLTDLGDFVDLPLGAAAARRARPSNAEASLDSLAAS